MIANLIQEGLEKNAELATENSVSGKRKNKTKSQLQIKIFARRKSKSKVHRSYNKQEWECSLKFLRNKLGNHTHKLIVSCIIYSVDIYIFD